jgi:hypothetical protein
MIRNAIIRNVTIKDAIMKDVIMKDVIIGDVIIRVGMALEPRKMEYQSHEFLNKMRFTCNENHKCLSI